ncbi:MAG: FAD-binding protein, partial [Candidatus Dormibacteraceae bacterium]
HYTMGGMVTDLWGRTIIPGLLGTGECARIGLHGANRLASNSLLEAVVMGRRAGQVTTSPSRTQPISNYRVVKLRGEGEMRIEQLRRVISQAAGPTRRANTLRQAQAELASDRGASPSVEATRQLASWIIEAALTREESRGGHYRIDYPESDPRWREREIVIRNLTQTVDARQLPVEASVV